MSVGKELVDIIKKSESRETKAYDTTATVTRVEGSTIWVHIPGGVDETPVQKTINANPGDSVQVRVSGGSAWLVGNATAPPTDDGQAIIAQKIARIATKVAESAQKIAGNTNQYFWHTESGNDTGAHITEIPKADFLADPANGGGNLLARSNGIAVRDGLDELATFGASGEVIGKIGESHLEMDYHSMRLIDKDTNQYFFVSDLRDNDGKITETFVGDGVTKSFTVGANVINATNAVEVDGVQVSYSRTGNTFTLSSAPTVNAIITIKYTPVTSNEYKMYTFGIRTSNNGKGFMSVVEGSSSANGKWSHAEGYMTSAYGEMSHAEGFLTKGGDFAHAEGSNSTASGKFSHAQNVKTIAQRKSQTAIGEYNIVDTSGADETVRGKHVLIIGNGTDDSARSNALTVAWNGNTNIAGTLTQGSDRRLKDHISYLGDDAVDFIRQLKPAHYIKDDADHVGFYAQDVESVDTWNCMIGEMNGYKTLGYTELIAPLVAYCQHLEKRIEELEDKK